MQMLLLIWHMREGIRVRCDDNDDVMKIRITMTMTMTTPWITPTVMVITTMAMAVALFFLSQLRSVFRTVRKSCNPGAGTPVLSQRNCGGQSKSGEKCTSMSGLAHRGDFTHLPYHSSRLVANQMCLARKRAAMAPTWRVAATRVFALPQAKRVAYTD